MSVPTVVDWLTVSEAAREARVSERTIRRQIAAGELTVRYIGRCVRVEPVELQRWAATRPTKKKGAA